MKLAFEHWIEDNIQRESSKNTLFEAISCYKISAYRAALSIVRQNYVQGRQVGWFVGN